MILGIAEDYSLNGVSLDNELTDIPDSGIYANSGIHPSITLANLLAFLPKTTIQPSEWNYTKTYKKYETLRQIDALCIKTNKMYQSLKGDNINQNPATETDYWLITNAESLKLKSFLQKVKDRVYSDLKLEKRLVNNQYLYEVGRFPTQLPNDYNGWVFEAKGSDYVKFRINSISFQKTGSTPINLYVVNQGRIIDTLIITPSNGVVDFKPLNYTFSGTGKWMFVFESTDVITNHGIIDPLNYDGFECYTCSGIGNSPETAEYSYQTISNGLGFNISVYLDSTTYIDNNFTNFAPLVRAAFEYMAFEMFAANSHNVSEMAQRIQMDNNMLKFQVYDTNPANNSSINRYQKELRKAKDIIDKTFDTQLLLDDDGINVQISSI